MRNENGFGSVVCLDKTKKKRRKPWAVRITVGWENGTQKRKYLGYYKSQAEALVALAEYHRGGANIDFSKLTLNEIFDIWFKRIETKASRTVLTTHKMAYNRFGSLGKKELKTIKAAHLQDWMDAIELKPGSKQKLKSTMIQIYDYAVQNDVVNKNYAKFIEINEKIEKSGKVFSNEEIEVLWSRADEYEIQNILVLIYTGMRIGEFLTLEKENIDLEKGYAIGGSKSDAGRNRVIPFHDKILPIIKDRVENHKFIMKNEKGNKMTYRSFQYGFGKLMTELGWEHKIHDTRKTGISIMHTNGIPMETIRIIVGHSGKGVTENVYLYKDPVELVKEINKIKI